MTASKHSLRVLQIVPSLEMGGVERGTLDLAIYLKKKGAFPVVASAGGRLVSFLRKNEIIHEYLPLDSKNPLTIWLNTNRIMDLIKKHQIDIIHVRSRAPAWSAYRAAKKMRVPLVTTFHGVYGFKTKPKKFYNSIMTRGKKVIAVSRYVAKHIKDSYGVASDKIAMIHRGVDLSIFDPDRVTESRIEAVMHQMQLPDDKYIVLVPGRVSRGKGHSVLLEALARLKREDVICLVVGKASSEAYVKELEEQAVAYGMRDRLYIIDECKDMPALYKLASLVVCPSTKPESFGRTVAEACAMGCMVLASNHGGPTEIITHGETGWLFPPEDSRALAQLIAQDLGMPIEKRKAIRHKAMEFARKHFDVTTMLSKTYKVYQDVYSGS